MLVNSVSSRQTTFGLKQGMIIPTIFNVARKIATRQAKKNPEIVAQTDRLIRRITKRAPGATLITTGGDFRLLKGGREYYMTDIVPGKRLIPSLENLDYKLAQFDKDVKSGNIKFEDRMIDAALNKRTPVIFKSSSLDLGAVLSEALRKAKAKK